MTRLLALYLAIASALAVSPLPAAAAEPGADAPPAGRPNILFIMSDEHNAAVTGCYGNRLVRTPNLDRLAASGVVFDAAYCNSPLCVPSRLSFIAGKYVSRVGAWSNSCWLPSDDYPTIAHLLNSAGYESILCGKMHFDPTRRYGFRDVAGTNSNMARKDGRTPRRDPDNLTAKSGRSGRFDDFHPGDESAHSRHDLQVTAAATRFLNERKPGDKPFFMVVGYLAPHFPLIVPEKYWAPYKGKVPMPVIPDGYLDALPLNYRHLRAGFDMTEVDDETVRRGRELYYGFTQWMDEQVGLVLGALEKSGLAENTVIIYTTDHGENMGEHGLWWKNCVFDTAAKVPLIVSFPPRFKGGQRRGGACGLVDVTRTIAELAGARTPEDWNGTSMVKWMEDPDTPWKDLAVSEYYGHNIASGYVMIRQGPWKYVYHTAADERHPAERELYNLDADPGELKNLAGVSGHEARMERMHAALVAEIGEDPEATERRCRADSARGYDRPDPRPRRGRPAGGQGGE